MGFLTFTRADAIEAGFPTYYTGRACIRGHVGLRYARTKACCECSRSRALQSYYANPEAFRAANSEWRRANPERVSAYAAQRLASGAMRRSHQAWSRANPDKAREYCQRRRAMLRGNGANDLSAADIAEISERQGHKCACCNRKTTLTVDHILPLSRGGENTKRNIQMLCRSCNSRKRASDPIEFARKAGRLL